MTTITASGTSPSIPVIQGTYLLDVSGSFGGGTVTPQQNINGTNWNTFTKSDGSTLAYTSGSVFEIDLAPCLIRYVTTSATSPVVFAIGKPITMVGSGQSPF